MTWTDIVVYSACAILAILGATIIIDELIKEIDKWLSR